MGMELHAARPWRNGEPGRRGGRLTFPPSLDPRGLRRYRIDRAAVAAVRFSYDGSSVSFRLGWWVAALSPLAYLAVGLAIARSQGQRRAHVNSLSTPAGPRWGLPAPPWRRLVARSRRPGGADSCFRRFNLAMARNGPRSSSAPCGGCGTFRSSSCWRAIEVSRPSQSSASASALLLARSWRHGFTTVRDRSALAVAIWHASYNMASGTAASSGAVAAVASALIIAQAVVLLRLHEQASRRGLPPVLGPPARTLRPG